MMAKKSIDEMVAQTHPAEYSGPLGSGFSIGVPAEYQMDNRPETVYHHFITHGVDGKPLNQIKHFTVTDRTRKILTAPKR